VVFFVVILMYVIFLNKLRFDQINYSARSGTCWQYEVPKWYEIVKRLGTAGCSKLKDYSLGNRLQDRDIEQKDYYLNTD